MSETESAPRGLTYILTSSDKNQLNISFASIFTNSFLQNVMKIELNCPVSVTGPTFLVFVLELVEKQAKKIPMKLYLKHFKIRFREENRIVIPTNHKICFSKI